MCSPLLCTARRDGRCFGFTHCLRSFRVRPAGRAVAPGLLMVYLPLLCVAHQIGRCSSVLMASASFRVRLVRMAIALVSLMVCFPFSCTTRRDSHCFSFAHCVRPLSCEACWDGHCSGFAHGAFAPFHAWLTGMAVAPVSLMLFTPCFDGHCSGFAHGVFAPFMHGSLGRLLLLSCSCLLLPWFFYVEVAWVTVALVSPMGVCVATPCCTCLLAHCLARCCARCTAHG